MTHTEKPWQEEPWQSKADRWDAISYEAQLLLLDKHNLLGGCTIHDITEEMIELGEGLDKIVRRPLGRIPLPERLEKLNPNSGGNKHINWIET